MPQKDEDALGLLIPRVCVKRSALPHVFHALLDIHKTNKVVDAIQQVNARGAGCVVIRTREKLGTTRSADLRSD